MSMNTELFTNNKEQIAKTLIENEFNKNNLPVQEASHIIEKPKIKRKKTYQLNKGRRWSNICKKCVCLPK